MTEYIHFVYHHGGILVKDVKGGLQYINGRIDFLQRMDVDFVNLRDLDTLFKIFGYEKCRRMMWLKPGEKDLEKGLMPLEKDADVNAMCEAALRVKSHRMHVYFEDCISVPNFDTVGQQPDFVEECEEDRFSWEDEDVEEGGACGNAEEGGASGFAEEGGASGFAEEGGASGFAEEGGASRNAEEGGCPQGGAVEGGVCADGGLRDEGGTSFDDDDEVGASYNEDDWISSEDNSDSSGDDSEDEAYMPSVQDQRAKNKSDVQKKKRMRRVVTRNRKFISAVKTQRTVEMKRKEICPLKKKVTHIVLMN